MSTMTSTSGFPCLLCSKTYNTKKKLQSHERNKHKNNKLIPHCHLLCKPSDDTLSFYQDTIIICLKNSLGFNRYSIGKKHITIDAFPENVFCTEGEKKLKRIFKYDEIIFCEDINTSTRGYILFEDNDGQYKITFSWMQKERKKNNKIF
ncbi:11249_t:CDS:2 [Gigaspora rosea]|nr:11249_t:CDS:2 [Gigaspora rosea]